MSAYKEFLSALNAWPIWSAIAKDDVVGRYRRSVLGPLWLVLSQAGLIAGLYILHRGVFGSGSDDYLLWLSVSLPIWGLLVALVVDGASSIQRAKQYLESYPLPPAIFPIRTVIASLITFAHLLLVFVILAFFKPPEFGFATLAVIPGLALVVAFGLGVSLLLGAIGARFHDVPLAMPAIMNLLFVLTPVFWIPTAGQLNSPLVVLNPFYHLLEVVRAPLLGHLGEPTSWAVAAAVSLATLLVGAVTFARMRPTLIYWL